MTHFLVLCLRVICSQPDSIAAFRNQFDQKSEVGKFMRRAAMTHAWVNTDIATWTSEFLVRNWPKRDGYAIVSIPTYHPLRTSNFYVAAQRRLHNETVKEGDTVVGVRLGHSGNLHWRLVILKVNLMVFTCRCHTSIGKR